MSVGKEPIRAMDFLKQKFEELLLGAELCIAAKLISPALVLVYSGIDVAGWLYASDSKAKTRIRFEMWVVRYLLPAGTGLGVSASDLYGARCGLLHNFGAESDLSRRGEVRQIQYAWGASSAETLIEMAKTVKMEKQHTAIKVENLVAAFRSGLARFFEDAAADPQIASRLEARSGKVFGARSDSEMNELLSWGKELLGDS